MTVHTQQNASHTQTQTHTPNKPHMHHDSVSGVDSLEKILDTTDETMTGDESDGVGESVPGSDGWSDEPYLKSQQQGGYRQQDHYHLPQHALLGSPPTTATATATATTASPLLVTPTLGYFSPVSQYSQYSDDDTNTTATPSEKALRAAEELKRSFEQRRRQRAAGMRTPVTIHEELERIPQARLPQAQAPIILGGVAGKRRAEADARNTAAVPAAAAPAPASTRVEGNSHKEQLRQTAKFVPVVGRNENRETSAEVENGGEQQQQQQKIQQQVNNDKSNKNGNYTLHDLCDEAIDTEDLAWRNALYLLSVQPHLGRQIEPECNMSPLHVACLAQHPPPLWLTRGLLYASPETCSQTDTGGRLPLHLLVATSAHIGTIRLLVEEYPPGVAHRDDRGFTPLQLLLKRNDSSGLTLEHLRLLLGQQMDDVRTTAAPRNRKNRLLFRKGDHLKSDWVLQELESLAEEREQKHEAVFQLYPDDVRQALTKLCQWKRRQVNKQQTSSQRMTNTTRSDEENNFLRSREAEFVTPASIPTPTGQLLPLHLLVRQNTLGGDAIAVIQDIRSVKRATHVDLLRILIAAYPEGLVGVDANGKTPLMTAMVQSDTSPSEEVVELLLGLRTPGFDGRNGIGRRPVCIASGDTFQMPLHVAAEELLSKYSLLSTICEAYPDARTIQDVRGRTPLHLAFQNYRSVPVDEATLELLFVEPVAKIRDNDGKTPLDLLLENPACVIREASQEQYYSSTILQEFFDASVDRPRNRLEAESFLRTFQSFPPWLRRQACAARFVQDILVEEMASPFTTFRILGSGIVLSLLLVALRRMLHLDPDYTFLIYYLATYHFVMQMIHWGIAIYMGEFYRLCLTNVWRWIDFATVVLSTWCAIYVSRNVIDINDGAGTILVPLGAAATMACWLSLLGYFVEWSCSLAVFIGSAVQLLSALVWPLCVAAMGFFAASQVLYTLEDCIDGRICSLSESYKLIYSTMIGHPVLAANDDYEVPSVIFVIVLLFTILCLWWIVSVIAIIVTEASRMDRQQLSLAWYWEPKSTLTVLTSTGSKQTKISESPSLVAQYCDGSEKYWHIFSSALRGEMSDVHWDACCFQSTPMLMFTGFLAFFVLPIWFVLGLLTLGVLWPPQIRRWIFCPRPFCSTMLRKSRHGRRPYGLHEDDLTKIKLSRLRTDLIDLKAITQDQNHRIRKDLGSIKDVIFRAVMDDD